MMSLRFQIIYSCSENYEIRTAPDLGLWKPWAVSEIYLTQNIIFYISYSLVLNRGAQCLVSMWGGVLGGTPLFTAFVGVLAECVKDESRKAVFLLWR